jgi:predicted RNase H-like HicB family nuclease
MKFLVTIERDEEGFFVVECPSLPECMSRGD